MNSYEELKKALLLPSAPIDPKTANDGNPNLGGLPDGRPAKQSSQDSFENPKALSAFSPQTARAALKKFMPFIYKKALLPSLTKKEQRLKAIELIEWFASKNGMVADKNCSIQFWMDKQKHDGKILLMLRDASGTALVAVDVRWDLDKASGHKLQASYAQGSSVMMVILDTLSEQKSLEFCSSFKVFEKNKSWLCVSSPNQPSA